MKANITAGECLKEILEERYKQSFIPFNEEMIKGEYHSRLFSEEFIKERVNTHSVTKEEYMSKLNDFINLIRNIDKYNDINLYFGNDEFCIGNKEVVIKTLKEYGYKGIINSYTVDENNGDVLSKEIIKL